VRNQLKFSAGLIGFHLAVFGQAPQSPTASRAAQPELPLILKQYNYGAQIGALNNLEALDPSVKKEPVIPQFVGGAQSVPRTDSPVTSTLTPDINLSPTALAAVRVSEKWRGEPTQPAPGPNGLVLFSFGAGLPTVVCAPLRVCIIELQAGEHIVGEPQIGDSVRWNISPAMYGAGGDATSVIVLKPTISGLDTNLLIATDRRAYYLRLISKPEEYVARVAFQYAEDDNSRKWHQQMIEQQLVAKRATSDSDSQAVLPVDRLNFGYRISGSNEHLRPLRVYDDGAKTYIQMPPEITHREVPVLLVMGADSKGEMTNYRVRQQTYIVDRLFDRAQLVLGTGKKSQKVEINREPKG
jgi:type IV secretion system protein VirB9